MAWELINTKTTASTNGVELTLSIGGVAENASLRFISDYPSDNNLSQSGMNYLKYRYRVKQTLNGTTKKTLILEKFMDGHSATFTTGWDTVYTYTLERELKNTTPTVTLTSPTDAQTLYENSTLPINGNATDADNGNIVNVRYSINDGTARALATGISDGTTAIPFAKTLTFKNGKLFDGDTAITDSLAEGTAHMLRVWATDDQGATSTIISRSFYAVPNRAPSLTVDTPQPTGTINSDKFAITGTCSDIDGNEVTVAYRINGANPVQIYKGQDGAWSFDVSLSALQVGANSIVIEVTDSYNFKATKTVKLNKNEIKTPVNTATARYKLTPPKGSATGVLLWVRRTETLQLDAKISMTLKGEQEQYFAPTGEITTAQVAQGIVEDEFIFSTAEAKTDIVLKLEMTKTQDNDAITLVTGVFN